MSTGESELLRFVTAGSVDDGKSTLIGRLLHDCHSIYQDQISSLRAASGQNGVIDFAFVTDGLRAEREQGITIDVAYRHFSTPRRRFILADAPGHEQYTANMATGASTASLAVLLVDVSKGVRAQTHRHAAIARLLGIRDFVVVVNKMDLAGFKEAAFRAVVGEVRDLLSGIRDGETHFIPVCSTEGDNIISRSPRVPWYEGPALLPLLESVPIRSRADLDRLRLPIQYVIRSPTEARRYAGELASGVLRKGALVRIMPAGHATSIASIRVGDRELEMAFPPLSVSVALDNDLDIGRGDMIVDPANPPSVSRRITATLLWTGEGAHENGRPYLLKHTTRQVCASIVGVNAVLDPATLDRRAARQLGPGEFGEVEIETHQPLYYDPYAENRLTGAFILIDPLTNATLGAGMIAGAPKIPRWQDSGTARAGLTVWFTGLSSAGKSTISQIVFEKLWAMGYKVELLDGDVIRQRLNKGLGFSKEDRDENIRRIGFIAELLTRNGVIAIVAAISPYREVRNEVRQRIGAFLEVYVNAPLDICEQRDRKGIYRRGRAGEISGVTGLDDPYEAPQGAEVECHTERETPAESAARVLAAIEARLKQKTVTT